VSDVPARPRRATPADERRPPAGAGVLLVDWLGRGGIAHTTESWARELRHLGMSPQVVTRAGRELAEIVPDSIGVEPRGGPVLAHVALARAAVRALDYVGPVWLVLQGTVAPQVELSLVRAARRRGVKVAVVAHEYQPTRRSPLDTWALRLMWRLADVIVVHSRFVGGKLADLEPAARTVLMPFPKTPILLDSMEGYEPVLPHADKATALTFGQLQKSYKGSDVICDLAERAGARWRFALVGTGISETSSSQVAVHSGFLPAGQLAATVAAADVVLLPYRRASQSGAVVLAQEAGTPVVASAVGGIPEQISDGETGILVPRDAGAAEWLGALDRLEDAGERSRLSRNALEAMDRQHSLFVEQLRALLLS
jgi:glycosyltransferase involved in cell wall biosynthesis